MIFNKIIGLNNYNIYLIYFYNFPVAFTYESIIALVKIIRDFHLKYE